MVCGLTTRLISSYPPVPILILSVPENLPGQFYVWLCSEEAKFLKNKFVWANWDVDELIARAEEIQNSNLLTIGLRGVDL